MNTINFADAEVLARFPDYFHPDQADAIPDDLIGSTIVKFGTLREREVVEGGGLVIDYQPRNSTTIKRLVLGFNELGMWQEYPDSGL